MYCISIVSTKGGVGKTTLAANLSALLADIGYTVCMIDADPQASLSKYYPLSYIAPGGLVELALNINPDDSIISKTIYPNLDIVLSNDPSGQLQVTLPSRPDSRARLGFSLRSQTFSHYDVVIIDSQGAQGILQDAAAYAGNIMISPVVPNVLDVREFMSGMQDMLNRLKAGDVLGLKPPPLKALIAKMDRTKNAQDIYREFESSISKNHMSHAGAIQLLETIIPSAKAYPESATKRLPVHIHDLQQTNKTDPAYTVMHKLLWELFPNTQGAHANLFVGGIYPEAQVAGEHA